MNKNGTLIIDKQVWSEEVVRLQTVMNTNY